MQKDILDKFIMSFAWVITFAAILLAIAPLTLSILYICAILILLILLYLQAFSRDNLNYNKPFLGIIILFAAYIALSSFWSEKITDSLYIATIIITFIPILFLPHFLKAMTDLQLYRIIRGIFLGILIGLCYIVIEYSTDFALIKSVITHQTIFPYHFNRHVALLTIFLWSILLITQTVRPLILKKIIYLVLFIAFLFVISQSANATAQISFVTSLTTFFLVYFFKDKAFHLIRGLWILPIIFIVPISIFLGEVETHKNELLPLSARVRIVIWQYTGKQISEGHQVIGHGIHASQYKTDNPKRVAVSKTLTYSPKAHHPHNNYLQIWYELGAIGASFLLIIGLMLIHKIQQLDPVVRPYALASFIAYFTNAMTGYGIWETWILASHGWAVIFMILACEFYRRYALDSATKQNL